MGIGLGEAVCQNLNAAAYRRDPDEFLYYMIHEAAHVLYERRNPIPPLREVVTPAQQRAYFALWVQNEGVAVYAALGPEGVREAFYMEGERFLEEFKGLPDS